MIDNNRYENIIASIVEVVVYKVNGVASLSTESGSSKKKMFTATNGVHVYISQDKVTIDVSINAYANQEVNKLAYEIQQSIIAEVEKATSYKVKTVNVNVIGVVFPS